MFEQSAFADLAMTLPEELLRQVMDELQNGERAQSFLIEKEQEQIAAQEGEHIWVNGLGEKVMTVSARAYHYWGQRLGYACWRDKKFRKEFLRDNPAARVRTIAPKVSLRVQGFAQRAAGLVTARTGGTPKAGGIVLTTRNGAVI